MELSRFPSSSSSTGWRSPRFFNPLTTCETLDGSESKRSKLSSLESTSYNWEVGNSAEPGYSPVFRTAEHPDMLNYTTAEGDVYVGNDIFQHGKRISGNGPCLGSRVRDSLGVLTDQVEWLSYSEVDELATSLGSGLLGLDCVPTVKFPEENYEPAQKLRLLGLLSVNRVEWFVLEQMAHLFTIALVPLYDTLGVEAIKQIVNACKLTTVVCGGVHLEQILKVKPYCPRLSIVVVFDMPHVDVLDLSVMNKAEELGVTVLKYSHVLKTGSIRPFLPNLPTPDDVWTICYTSGTSGSPKGVILSQSNLVANVCAAAQGSCSGIRGSLYILPSDCHLSFLTMAHVYERIMVAMFVFHGCRVAAFSGNLLRLADDLKAVRPTLFMGVPRLLTRIHDKIMGEVATKSKVAQSLFHFALSTKMRRLVVSGDVTHPVWDRILFNKIKQVLGGKVKWMLSAGAPLDPIIGARLKCMLCSPLMEGYGLTETVGSSFISNPFDPMQGHVGRCSSAVEYRLKSIPEMNYNANEVPRQGELLLRGPGIFKGYFNAKNETDAVVDSHGFFHTGDVASLLSNGAIRIIDRKKNIFKLAQGEYISPEKVENAYIQAPLVSQAFVFGYGTKSFLVCIIVPDEDVAKPWAVASGKSETLEDLVEDKDFISAVRKQLDEVSNNAGLKGFERAKSFRLVTTPFTVENGLITPSMKIKRHVARNVFNMVIDQMYVEEETKPLRHVESGIF